MGRTGCDRSFQEVNALPCCNQKGRCGRENGRSWKMRLLPVPAPGLWAVWLRFQEGKDRPAGAVSLQNDPGTAFRKSAHTGFPGEPSHTSARISGQLISDCLNTPGTGVPAASHQCRAQSGPGSRILAAAKGSISYTPQGRVLCRGPCGATWQRECRVFGRCGDSSRNKDKPNPRKAQARKCVASGNLHDL